MNSIRAVSLLETVLSITLMALTLWSIQWLYVSLLRGTKLSETRRAAIVEAEYLHRVWRDKALELWPEGYPTGYPPASGANVASPEAMAIEDQWGDYLYRVELSGRIVNPVADGLLRAPLLEMQLLKVRLFYRENEGTEGPMNWVEIQGSVSR